MTISILQGDVVERLREIPDGTVHCVVTSPPYFQLRDYQVDGQIGLEKTPEEYVQKIVIVSREIRRILRDDGTYWLNEGDCYNSTSGFERSDEKWNRQGRLGGSANRKAIQGLKPKDLFMMPARVAIALQADGWYLRSQIPWLKRNSMPESCTDRPSSAVEYIYLLTKSGEPIYWVHRDGMGSRIKPKADYRYVDLLKNIEYTERPLEFNSKDKLLCPQCEGKGELSQGWFAFVDVCPKCKGEGKLQRWNRINLWRGEDYYYDADAIRVRYSDAYLTENRPMGVLRQRLYPDSKYLTEDYGSEQFKKKENKQDQTGNPTYTGFNDRWKAKVIGQTGDGHKGYVNADGTARCPDGGRNRRNSDWFFESWQGLYSENGDPLAMIVNPQPFAEAHFATFPEALVEPCIKAGTSERGCCPVCGAPWERVVETNNTLAESRRGTRGYESRGLEAGNRFASETPGYTTISKTLGWQPTCKCEGYYDFDQEKWFDYQKAIPCTVLDPFMGSGTTLKVARDLKRDAIGIEINPVYVRIARERLRLNEQLVSE